MTTLRPSMSALRSLAPLVRGQVATGLPAQRLAIRIPSRATSIRALNTKSAFHTATRTSLLTSHLCSRYRFNSTSSATPPPPTLTSPAVAKWLYATSGLVFFIVVVGGVTRLTESGLSITEWEPVKGILPPLTEEQWQVEWEKYRVTPEGVL